MAKQHKISSSWEVKGGVLSFQISATEADGDKSFVGKFSRSLNLSEVMGDGYASLNEVGRAAIEFGAFTALRNATGSCETLSEAETAVDRRLDAWASNQWGAERETSATPFSENHMLARAVERASGGAQTAAQAAEKLCALAEAACKASGLAEFSALSAEDRAKIRKAIVDQVRDQKPAIAVAYKQLEAEQIAERAARMAREAEKKRADLGDSGDATL